MNDSVPKNTRITPELLEQLEKEGYEIRLKGTFVRKTFVVEKSLLEEFMRCRARLGIKVQEALDMALREWIKQSNSK